MIDNENEVCGFVNILKPTGMTSFDVVRVVKKTLGTKRVGHLGTLDPAAAGVLPVAVGKATKFFDYFLNKDKVYFAVIKFGIETDTMDSYGKVIMTEEVDVCESELESAIQKFIGKQLQVPPKFSAVKVDGKKAYELARENADFELKPREIEVFDIKIVKKVDKNAFLLKVHSSAGTYIRTLMSDIAKALNAIAFTPVIIRTKSGAFCESEAMTLDEFKDNPKVFKIQEVLHDKPIIRISDRLAKKVLNGVKVCKDEFEISLENDSEFFIEFENRIVGLFKVSANKLERVVYIG